MGNRFSTFVCLTAWIAAIPFTGTESRVNAAPQGDYQPLDMPEKYRLTPMPPAGSDKKAIAPWRRENTSALRLIRSGNSSVKKLLESGGDITAAPEELQYVQEYVFPIMTQTDPSTISSLGEKRRTFLRDYLNDDVTGNARQKMIEVTIDNLSKIIVNDTLHPSARINASVLLARLTDRPASRREGVTPILSADAFNVLVQVFVETDPQRSPDYLKCSVLSGIKHHLETRSLAGQEIDTGIQNTLLTKLTEILKQPADAKKSPSQYWQKRLSIPSAGLVGDGATMQLIAGVLIDEQASFAMKMDAIQAIERAGSLDNSAAANQAVLVKICKFAVSAVGNEAQHLSGARDKMVYDNMLYGNLDLQAEGIDFQKAVPAKTGPEAAESTAAAAGRSFDPSEFEDLGGGFADFDDGEFGSFGGTLEKEPVVELPNYLLQNSRSRLKAVAFYCRNAIGGTQQDGIRRFLDAGANSFANRAVAQFDQLMEQSNLGLVDLDIRAKPGQISEEEKDLSREKSYASQMIELCESTSRQIGNLVKDFKDE